MASEDGATTTTATATRCYWAILNSSMAFQYLDPVFQQHMKEQASSMLGKQLTDFIHPEENLVAQEDFAKFQSSGIIFGSVTRCRYAKISHCRKILGAEDVAQEDENNQWISARITSSLVAPNTVLAFFHEIPEDADETAAADGNDCGPTSTEVSGDLFNSKQIEMLTKAFTSCQADSEEVKSKIADQTFRLKTDPFPPPYVFQLLATGSDNIIFTWPPVKGTGDDADTAANGTTPDNGNGERYQPVECAALARSVALPTGGADAGEASTNCTKRYQSKHPVLAEGGFTNVESVVITYQGLTIVCFRSGGLALNRNIFSPPDLSVADNSSSKRKDMSDPAEDEAIKRIRTAISQHDSGDMPVPNVESLNTSWHPDGQQFTNIPNSPGLGGNTQVPQWTNDDPNSANSLQSPYYGSYPSVYSNMFSNDGRSSGNFMDGSTNIPPMPAPSQPTGSNGLANLALASSSSYYTDYNKQGQQLPVVQGQENQYQNTNQNNGNNIPTGSGSDVTPSPVTPALSQSGEQAMPVVHRVRKNDRGRICTSCGTTNSPEWRKGPSGIKTLCNACGLRYSRAQTRKLKKAQKQQDAENQAVPNSADGSFASAGPNDPYGALPPKPIQIPNSASTATGPTSAGTPHSPFIPIGDYSVHAPLPPLPTPAQDDPPHSAGSTNGSGSNNIPTGATGNGNYGAYGNYVNYAFDQWGSPTQTSFSQGQQGGN